MGELVDMHGKRLSARERRIEKVEQARADYAALDMIEKLRVECGAVEDALLSAEGVPRGTANVTITTERGVLLHAALCRLRHALATAERMKAQIEEKEVDHD
jgi:hypothetical protein